MPRRPGPSWRHWWWFPGESSRIHLASTPCVQMNLYSYAVPVCHCISLYTCISCTGYIDIYIYVCVCVIYIYIWYMHNICIFIYIYIYTQYIHVYMWLCVHIRLCECTLTGLPGSRPQESIYQPQPERFSRLQSVAIPNASSTEKHLGHENLQSYPDLSSYLIVIYNHD